MPEEMPQGVSGFTQTRLVGRSLSSAALAVPCRICEPGSRTDRRSRRRRRPAARSTGLPCGEKPLAAAVRYLLPIRLLFAVEVNRPQTKQLVPCPGGRL
jgi:hypothetical protein